MEWLRGSPQAAAQLISLSCDHCGAPLTIPDGASAVLCAYCGARLEVLRTRGDTDSEGSDHDQKNRNAASMPPKSTGNGNLPAGDRSGEPVAWQVVASFKFVSDWHEAAHTLARVGITARMQDDPKDASYSTLAVPTASAETARQLLQPGRTIDARRG